MIAKHMQKLCSTVFCRLQRKYIQVPGNVSVSAKDVYDSYVRHKRGCADESLLSKKQVSQIVPALLSKITVVKQSGPSKYKGLRLNFFDDQTCSEENLKTITSEHGFFQVPTSDSNIKYSIYTGYCVNKNEQLKSVTIKADKSFDVTVGGIFIDLPIIGLQNMKINSINDAKIVFNTVKQAKVCRGKLVSSKRNTTKFSIVQEWFKHGEENSLELRLSAGKCQGVLSFTSYFDTCSTCQAHTFTTNTCNKAESAENINKEEMLKSLFPGASDIMINMLTIQSKICESSAKDNRSRRWTKDIIQVALTFWNRSPKAYASLKNSGMIFLPSENLLQRYKNCFEQVPGLNDNMFVWMFKESERLNTEKHGGLILDEMSVQEDLKMGFFENQNKIDGLTDMGKMPENLHLLTTHKSDVRIATHVMQFIFLSYDGFRFPFAYYPSMGANASEIYLTVWESISKLSKYEFVTDYICFDGASNNRSFQQMHFKDSEDQKMKNYTTKNPFRPSQEVTLLMDYSHNIKKLRNNIHYSGDHESCTRKLQYDNLYIVWDHWINAFNWDRCHNCVRIHRKLTNEHIFLTKTSKMRNHLAEDVLNRDMLHLMKIYKESLADGAYLVKSIELLEHTSAIIDLFRDRRPIADINDERLRPLKSFENWLDQWADTVDKMSNATPLVKAKKLISKETYNDIISMIRGFLQICMNRITKQKRSIVPAGINSDVVENFFCQQRTICNGSNANPTIHQYKYGINSIILGQNAVSKKSNAANKRKCVQPFSFTTPQPQKKAKLRI